MTEPSSERASSAVALLARSRARTRRAEHRLDDEHAPTEPRRAQWRQRLVDLERGFSLVLRIDGTLFVLLFGAAATLLAGGVVGLTLDHWVGVTLAITVVLVSGMFHQVLKAVWRDVGHHLEETGRAAIRMGAASVYVACCGAGIAILLIFADRLQTLFRG